MLCVDQPFGTRAVAHIVVSVSVTGGMFHTLASCAKAANPTEMLVLIPEIGN